MPPPRREAITLLCDAALEGMRQHGKVTTSTEVFSACMTLALHAVTTAIDLGLELDPYREIIARIYAQFPPEIVN